MLDLDRLKADVCNAVHAGNLFPPLRMYCDLLATASQLEKRCIYTEMQGLLDQAPCSLAPKEIAYIQDALASLTIRGSLVQEHQAVLKRLEALPRFEPLGGIGRAYILVSSQLALNGQRFGAMPQLQVTSSAWEGQILLPQETGDSIYGGFRKGVRAAQEYLFQRGLGTLDGSIRLQSHTFIGEFPNVRAPIEGPSLGLGSAIAALSQLLRLPVPDAVAFTGEIDVAGDIHKVGDAPIKLQTAVDKGIQRVYLPQSNMNDSAEVHDKGLTLHPVQHLSEVVESLYDSNDIQAGIDRLHAQPLPEGLRERRWLREKPILDKTTRVLLSCVGRSDPLGRQLDQNRLPIGLEEGPILTLLRELRPQRIYLLHTEQGEANDYRSKARQVQQFLSSQEPDCQVFLRILPGISDPTDYAQLLPAFKTCITEILQHHQDDYSEFFVNLSSGTPQMETTWHLLGERGLLPASFLQVREGRFLRPDQTRVRRVILPIL